MPVRTTALTSFGGRQQSNGSKLAPVDPDRPTTAPLVPGQKRSSFTPVSQPSDDRHGEQYRGHAWFGDHVESERRPAVLEHAGRTVVRVGDGACGAREALLEERDLVGD